MGVLPRSGVNAPVTPREAEYPSELRSRADTLNAATLERVSRDLGADAEVTQILHRKAYEEARTARASGDSRPCCDARERAGGGGPGNVGAFV